MSRLTRPASVPWQSATERRRLEAAEADLRLERARRHAEERRVQEQLWTEQERLRRQRQAEEQERQREAAVRNGCVS